MTSTATDPAKSLPPRRAAFVREYLRLDLNASRAARDVGYAAKSASVEGSRLLANIEVQAEITRQRAILMEQSNVTPEKIVAELAMIALSDLGDYIRVHSDGTASIDLGDMPPGATRAIASLNTDTTKTAAGRQTAKLRIKLHDKQAALVSLAKIFGLLTGDSPGVSVVVNGAESVELATLSTAELRRGVELLALSEGENPRISAPNEAIFSRSRAGFADSHGPQGSEATSLSSVGSTEASEGGREVESGDLGPTEV